MRIVFEYSIRIVKSKKGDFKMMQKLKKIICVLLAVVTVAVGMSGVGINAKAATKPQVSFSLTDNPSSKTVTMKIYFEKPQISDSFMLYFDYDATVLSPVSSEIDKETDAAFFVADCKIKGKASVGVVFTKTVNGKVEAGEISFKYSELTKSIKITLTADSYYTTEYGQGYFESKSESIGSSYKKGDVNNDGKVDVDDARLVLRVSVKLETLTGNALLAADVDGKSGITVDDARLILRVAVKLDSFDKKNAYEEVKKFVKTNGEKINDNYYFTIIDGKYWYDGNTLPSDDNDAISIEIVYSPKNDSLTLSNSLMGEGVLDFIVLCFLKENEPKSTVSIGVYDNRNDKRVHSCLGEINNATFDKNTTIAFYYDENGAKNTSYYDSIIGITKEATTMSLQAFKYLLIRLGLSIKDFGFNKI